MNTHTQTPWMECLVVSGGSYEIIAPHVNNGKGEPLVVARCWTKENMRIIVHAVNEHKKLVELAKELLFLVKTGNAPANLQPERIRSFEVAIEKAEIKQ